MLTETTHLCGLARTIKTKVLLWASTSLYCGHLHTLCNNVVKDGVVERSPSMAHWTADAFRTLQILDLHVRNGVTDSSSWKPARQGLVAKVTSR